MPAHTKCTNVVATYILFTKLNYVCEVYQVTKPVALHSNRVLKYNVWEISRDAAVASHRLQAACHWFNQEAAVIRLTDLEHR
jgi:hypothetical protein